MSNPADTTPELTVVPDEVIAPEETVEETTEVTAEAPAPPAPKAISLPQQIRNYARLAVELKRETHLNEGTITRLIELALNERFTLIQMGLARPTSATEDPNGNEVAAQNGE